MMNWNEELDFTTNIKNNKLYVTLTVNHTKGLRGFQEKTYDTDFVIDLLKKNDFEIQDTLEESIVYNYQTINRCTGTWIFSLPKAKKTKKTTQPIENKETVIKMNSKKTTKK
tara:strand:- start:259 stop:594 length:336 start_codon:yes stop_codon:yes gene_type:complete